MNWLLIGTGGFLGAIARYALSGWVQIRMGGSFPVGTLAVNVLGCLILGGLMSLVDEHPLLSSNARSFLTIGILGAFTTYSTFGYETAVLVRDRELWLAGLNIFANLVVGLAAIELGRVIVKTLGV